MRGSIRQALTPLLALLAAPLFAEVTVMIDRPDPFTPAYGAVEVVASVVADEPVERVVVSIDGIVSAEMAEPPWRVTVDLGEENRSHLVEVTAYAASGVTASASVSTPSFRVDEEVRVALQQLYVTVSSDGHRMLDLEPDDFDIRDNGWRQELVTFARGDIPFTGMVLLDSSVSMRGAPLRAALAGARAFFGGMQPLDEASLLVFSDRILHSAPFTTYAEILSAGLDAVRAGGGTSINDHLFYALRRLSTRSGRPVVILLSDGIDSHSALSMDEVRAEAGESPALIYWLRLPYGREHSRSAAGPLPDISTPWRGPDAYRKQFQLLERVVRDSGGRIEPLASIDDIEDAFRGILEELRDQYVLGYYPLAPRNDGSWREVEVRVPRRGLEVRARGGYFDYER